MRQLFLLLFALIISAKGLSADFISNGWTIRFDETTQRLNIDYRGRQLMADAYAEARQGDNTYYSFNASSVSVEQNDVSDVFGSGRQLCITYRMDDGMVLIQTLSCYDSHPYMVAQLSMTNGSTTSSNYVLPLKSTTSSSVMPAGKKNRMLFVPWDNDGFIRYASNTLRSTVNSYAVTAIYNTDTRGGLICGALDHDLWKSAVRVTASDYDKVDELALISGYTDEHSHDSIQSEQMVMPHGAVVADTVRSARFMMGWFDDWRTGMETFGQACSLIAPKREWAAGAPYGWSSWGVQSTDISYQGVMDCGNFIRDNLVEHGFHDREGRVVLSLDAWWNDNLSVQQVKSFVSYCKENNMIPGLYYGSFCRFGDLQSYVPGTSNKYRFRDIALKVHGRYKVVDGAYCLDPTHVGTKQFMLSEMQKFKSWGIEYLKCDFMSNGAIEADSWYNKDCHTGIQAYNEGMACLMRYAGDMYLDLSIAPIFPYHYTHGRRISCDAWGAMDHTKYVMNNASYGWWLNQLYVANDPDHMVMAMRQEAGGVQSEGANRARITSGAVVGAFLTGDNFSPNVVLHNGSGKVGENYSDISQQRALMFLTNEDVNEIPRTCGSFRPVYGNASSSVGAESLMTYENDRYVYVAVFNYQMLMPLSGSLPFADLGIDAASIKEIKELWMGEMIDQGSTGFQYRVPACDARIYRIEKNTALGIVSAGKEQYTGPAVVFDLQGRRMSVALKRGIYIREGKKYIVK
ncbi:alpha-galactosidase [Xylanibacter brevis]|uniref:alpha-galactosidase n=1 Tax=Xylanibacter brevis TaxID=83231 RepID=UPI000AED28D4|nr:alpha-galactosidase [Xylanibacter brevis]